MMARAGRGRWFFVCDVTDACGPVMRVFIRSERVPIPTSDLIIAFYDRDRDCNLIVMPNALLPIYRY
jgi:hypothetical protein